MKADKSYTYHPYTLEFIAGTYIGKFNFLPVQWYIGTTYYIYSTYIDIELLFFRFFNTKQYKKHILYHCSIKPIDFTLDLK